MSHIPAPAGHGPGSSPPPVRVSPLHALTSPGLPGQTKPGAGWVPRSCRWLCSCVLPPRPGAPIHPSGPTMNSPSVKPFLDARPPCWDSTLPSSPHCAALSTGDGRHLGVWVPSFSTLGFSFPEGLRPHGLCRCFILKEPRLPPSTQHACGGSGQEFPHGFVKHVLHRSSLARALQQEAQRRLAWPALQGKKYMTITHDEKYGPGKRRFRDF